MKQPAPHPDRPTVPEVLPLVAALLVTDAGILGCCLRDVLESQCTSDAFVEDALERAVESGHRPCQELAYILSGMTRSQRSRLGQQGFRRARWVWSQTVAARRAPYERHAAMCRFCQPCRPCQIGRTLLGQGGFAA